MKLNTSSYSLCQPLNYGYLQSEYLQTAIHTSNWKNMVLLEYASENNKHIAWHGIASYGIYCPPCCVHVSGKVIVKLSHELLVEW